MAQLQRMSQDAIRRVAPSVFADQPFHKMSDRYSFVPTHEIVSLLESEGWFPVKAMENYTRAEGKAGFARHMVRFSREDGPMIVGDTTAQIVLTNSHDGTSGYLMDAGLFRLVCSNGMTVSEGNFQCIRVNHRGNIEDEIIDASYRIIENVPQLAESVESFKQTRINEDQAKAFAAAAIELKWPKEEILNPDGEIIKRVNTAPIEPRTLLTYRRWEDRQNAGDLWTTFNTVQENLIKGGIRGRASTGRRTTTRAVASVSEDVRINKALWTLAEEMRKLVA